MRTNWTEQSGQHDATSGNFMSNQDITSQELQDELSAYLDGELDADSVRRVEERLARDAAYRAELQKMERAWGMLDKLPRAAVDENFTRTTIEMVALSAAEEAAAAVQQAPARARRHRLVGLAAMAAALCVGFFIGQRLWPDPNKALLQDLPVVENLDLYYQADDLEFLKQLDEKGLFAEGDADHG